MTAESACLELLNCLMNHLGFKRESDLSQRVRSIGLSICEPIQSEHMAAVIVGVTTP